MSRIPVGRGDKGNEIFGETVEFEAQEQWSVYRLVDGTTIKLKPTVIKILKSEAYNDIGEPIYIVKSANLLDTEVPENLRKKPNA